MAEVLFLVRDVLIARQLEYLQYLVSANLARELALSA
jgi:hypothetical protein